MPDGLAGFRGHRSLNEGQRVALAECLAAAGPGERHLLEGEAGTGKTTLLETFIAERLHGQAQQRRNKLHTVVATAPTHKAVRVLAKKLRDAGLTDVTCRTTPSLLGLRPVMRGEIQTFIRDKKAKPIEADDVIVDECSMPGSEMMMHIRRHLPMAFVLFSGDEGQLPPIGEDRSEAFDIKSRSSLTEIVRQAEGNPIVAVSRALRRSQGRPADWSWLKPNHDGKAGVFLPRDPDKWLAQAFRSDEFAADPDAFRYLAYTNSRVAKMNAKIRAWRFGPNLPTPFNVGEMAMFRQPLIRGDTTLFSTGEETEVLEIGRGTFSHRVPECGIHEAWTAKVPSWVLTLKTEDGMPAEVHMPADDVTYNAVCARLADEAVGHNKRWDHLQDFKSSMVSVQPIYAMTVHSSQGSTFGRTFVDVPSIRSRFADNLLEAQRLLYVAATRPTTALMFVGVR